MSLIVGIRCQDGCLAIADRRTHIWKGGAKSYRDDFHKLVKIGGYVLYNHGYNRIDDADWKLRHTDLTPEKSNPIYIEILNEMATKRDQMASFVFLNRTELHEIVVHVGAGITYVNHLPNDRIISGSGDKYVDLKLLTDLDQAKCNNVRVNLQRTFEEAHEQMEHSSGIEFSKAFDIEQLLT